MLPYQCKIQLSSAGIQIRGSLHQVFIDELIEFKETSSLYAAELHCGRLGMRLCIEEDTDAIINARHRCWNVIQHAITQCEGG